jgi:hypothetical protein
VTNRTVLGVDAGSASLREADHLIHHLVDQLGLPAGVVACTHHIRTGVRHTAVSFTVPVADVDVVEAAWALLTAPDAEPMGVFLAGRAHGPAHLADAAGQAAAEATDRSSGRAVVYPGVERLTGTITVADVLAHTPIARLTVLGSAPGDHPAPTVEVLTRAHVRPEWRDGELVLPLVPAAGGLLAPFEVPNPTPCCADH